MRVTTADGVAAYTLSIMGRALDMRGYARALKDVGTILRTALQFEHYSPRDQARMRTRWAELATAEELWVLEESTGSSERAA